MIVAKAAPATPIFRAVQDNYNEIAYQGLSDQDKEQFNRLIS